MNPLPKLLTLVSFAAALAASTVGPDFQRPDPPKTHQYVAPKTTAESSPADRQELQLGTNPTTQWWHFFESDALDHIVDRALANNRRLTAAQWTLEQQQELVSARAGRRWPQVDGTAGIGRQKY